MCTENKVPTCSSSKVIAWTDTRTDRLDWNYYPPACTDGNKFMDLEWLLEEIMLRTFGPNLEALDTLSTEYWAFNSFSTVLYIFKILNNITP